ncbi:MULTISPECIES: NADPH:quinone oxidoreductase family protein [unclassified Corallococcus]|uniref:NADPH:quinone oxidoreductase family protein n=1 Tax=unclassified Corallococcus TaxID=2685029 RepID=UPI001A8BF813|nr:MULTISPECIES: NADPH:quinone oxidoreductase family protein [unclassified Corallococcus]MBN9682800.1 NADPH:quinone oxidoreductase family protein [Corallococcus sp. NCSPR001]WAS85661.1 NADPH:quinone oxidoreductase family protein [Corallococcus sp. NCRR]
MRALQLQRLAGPEGLAMVEVPEPEAGDGVLIDVVAAGVSFPDLLLTRGQYQMKPEVPFVPGVEVAGVVRSAPAGARVKPGDRVMGFSFTLGGFAEACVAAPELTFPIPEGWSFEQAAGVVMNYHTAHFALHRRGHLRQGETVLVHGAAGGVGTAAVQVAKGAGARVLAVVSDERKKEVAKRAGADAVLLSKEFQTGVREATDGRGADVVLDPVGGDVFEKSLKVLAPEGRLLVVGFASGQIPSVTVNRLLLRNVTVVGVAWGAFLMQSPELPGKIARDLEALAAKGIVNPVVGRVFPFENGAQALRELESRQAVGKIVLKVKAG